MLVIKSKSDLLEYYQARLNMARGQERTHRKKEGHIASGLIYAWEEAIKALEALIEFEKGANPMPIEQKVS